MVLGRAVKEEEAVHMLGALRKSSFSSKYKASADDLFRILVKAHSEEPTTPPLSARKENEPGIAWKTIQSIDPDGPNTAPVLTGNQAEDCVNFWTTTMGRGMREVIQSSLEHTITGGERQSTQDAHSVSAAGSTTDTMTVQRPSTADQKILGFESSEDDGMVVGDLKVLDEAAPGEKGLNQYEHGGGRRDEVGEQESQITPAMDAESSSEHVEQGRVVQMDGLDMYNQQHEAVKSGWGQGKVEHGLREKGGGQGLVQGTGAQAVRKLAQHRPVWIMTKQDDAGSSKRQATQSVDYRWTGTVTSGFEIRPPLLEVGQLLVGQTYRFEVQVVNVGVTPAKFRINHAQQGGCVRAIYRPSAKVAAGLGVALPLEVMVSNPGKIEGIVEAIGETGNAILQVVGEAVHEDSGLVLEENMCME
ncbi:unnamed protein product [Choristocarpus tenellus]